MLRFRSSLWTCQSAVSVNGGLFKSTNLHAERDQGESSPRLSRLVLSSHFLLPVRVSKCGAMEATSWPPATMVLRILLRYASTAMLLVLILSVGMFESKLTRPLQEQRPSIKLTRLTPAHAITQLVQRRLLSSPALGHSGYWQLCITAIHERHWDECGTLCACRAFHQIVLVIPVTARTGRSRRRAHLSGIV